MTSVIYNSYAIGPDFIMLYCKLFTLNDSPADMMYKDLQIDT